MQVPIDKDISIDKLTRDPYPLYQRMRAKTPVLKVASVGRILLTKAADTRYVKLEPELFSSDDPNTPMERAFQAKTLMRRDGSDHMRLRAAMMPAFSIPNIKKLWIPAFTDIVEHYVARLPRGEVVDFFPGFAGPVAARCLARLLGMDSASDEQMQRWSQTLINGAGNFGWRPEPFAQSDLANDEINACLQDAAAKLRGTSDQSALAVQINAEEPIEWEHILSNIKIAIGGGLNEPRDSMLTVLYGLLSHPEQLQRCREESLWTQAFEEAIRWVAPIQVSSRLAVQDTVIRDYEIAKGEVVMTVQASANHDEEIYRRGECFDMFRTETRHQAFGNGPHFCMGTHVARRLIGEVVLPILFDRFPDMSLADPDAVVWSGFGFRGPLNLPVLLK
ncbi:MAG: cytochrome P450 [Granulosicoccus sp.]